MDKPSHISVQGHAIKVQKWQIREQDIAVTTIATGDRSAADILALMGKGTVSVSWEGMKATDATIHLTDHRVAGAGATAIHRIAFALAAETFPRSQPQAAPLEIVLEELKRLRNQVADLEHRVKSLEEMQG